MIGGNNMEFLEFMKQKERMCSTCNCAEDCPMYRGKNAIHCNDFIRYHPKKAEKIVEKWAKENPPMTNDDKFKKVFGKSFENLCDEWNINPITDWLLLEQMDRIDKILRPFYIFVNPNMSQQYKDILSEYGKIKETLFVENGKILLLKREEIDKWF